MSDTLATVIGVVGAVSLFILVKLIGSYRYARKLRKQAQLNRDAMDSFKPEDPSSPHLPPHSPPPPPPPPPPFLQEPDGTLWGDKATPELQYKIASAIQQRKAQQAVDDDDVLD